MTQNLAVVYRPRKFEEIAGQKAVSALLKAMLMRNTLPNVLLLEGCKGSGKTTTARIVAASLNCVSDYKPCGECESCQAVYEGRSLAVREIDAASHGLVDDIRQLQESLLYAVPGAKSVLIIDEAQGLSKAASNALLKTLEFPPENTVFILITTESAKILPTIRSRCMAFKFKQIAVEDIYNRLVMVHNKEELGIEEAVLYQVALHSGGSLRDALITLDQLKRSGIRNIRQFELVFGDSLPGLSLVQSMLTGRHSAVFAEAEKQLVQAGSPSVVIDNLTQILRDIVVLKAGGTTALQGEDLKSVEKIMMRLDTKKVVGALRVMWDSKIKLRGNEQSTGLLYLTLTAVMDSLSIPVYDDTTETLTFEGMKSIIDATAI